MLVTNRFGSRRLTVLHEAKPRSYATIATQTQRPGRLEYSRPQWIIPIRGRQSCTLTSLVLHAIRRATLPPT
jgi:hypothetical protein